MYTPMHRGFPDPRPWRRLRVAAAVVAWLVLSAAGVLGYAFVGWAAADPPGQRAYLLCGKPDCLAEARPVKRRARKHLVLVSCPNPGAAPSVYATLTSRDFIAWSRDQACGACTMPTPEDLADYNLVFNNLLWQWTRGSADEQIRQQTGCTGTQVIRKVYESTARGMSTPEGCALFHVDVQLACLNA